MALLFLSVPIFIDILLRAVFRHDAGLTMLLWPAMAMFGFPWMLLSFALVPFQPLQFLLDYIFYASLIVNACLIYRFVAQGKFFQEPPRD
jgi:hypothetical protein